MRSYKKKRLRLIILLIFTSLIFINSTRGFNLSDSARTCKVAIKQLNYLEHELKEKDLGTRMQNVFPEGYVFINALYGLTWCELALNYDLDSSLTAKAYAEAYFANHQINSNLGKAPFHKNLEIEYGAFYSGWKNYLLGKILSFHSVPANDSLEFTKKCELIASAVEKSESPYIQSYPNSAWPADMFQGIASLKLYDDNFVIKYDTTISHWIQKVKTNLDPFTGLIPHSTFSSTGETLEGARGSSISLILRLLTEIDPEFATEQYALYKKYFQIKRLGVPAIREYPKGKEGSGDIDSGPVILDVGFAGTIVSIGVHKAFGDIKKATRLSNAMERYGVSYSINKRKRYVFGFMPISDAFIAWSRVSPVMIIN